MKISNYFAKEKMDDVTFIQTFIEKLNEIRQKTFQADAVRDKSEVSKT